MNPWLFSFLISITIFLVLIDWHSFRFNMWGGLFAAALKLFQDIIVRPLDLWEYRQVASNLPESFLFNNFINIFLLGEIFIMGTIFLQFLPKNMFLQLLHAYVWVFFHDLFNHLAEQFILIDFIYWRPWLYVHLIPITMLFLAWFKNNFNKDKEQWR